MERIIDVAQYIFDEYKKLSEECIDEMKLHKLLYFTQRESIAITGKPLFEEVFEGWKYGPVCREIRKYYTKNGIKFKDIRNISNESAYIAKNVVLQYGIYETWKLSDLSHKEESWKKSRVGMAENQNGSCEMKIDDIKKDAEKIRPYDSIWDMYYDEFEDIETVN